MSFSASQYLSTVKPYTLNPFLVWHLPGVAEILDNMLEGVLWAILYVGPELRFEEWMEGMNIVNFYAAASTSVPLGLSVFSLSLFLIFFRLLSIDVNLLRSVI